jgi:hypothetical protein
MFTYYDSGQKQILLLSKNARVSISQPYLYFAKTGMTMRGICAFRSGPLAEGSDYLADVRVEVGNDIHHLCTGHPAECDKFLRRFFELMTTRTHATLEDVLAGDDTTAEPCSNSDYGEQ